MSVQFPRPIFSIQKLEAPILPIFEFPFESKQNVTKKLDSASARKLDALGRKLDRGLDRGLDRELDRKLDARGGKLDAPPAAGSNFRTRAEFARWGPTGQTGGIRSNWEVNSSSASTCGCNARSRHAVAGRRRQKDPCGSRRRKKELASAAKP